MLLDDNNTVDLDLMEDVLVLDEDIKDCYCELYRAEGCVGCKYFETEDEVCRFDK